MLKRYAKYSNHRIQDRYTKFYKQVKNENIKDLNENLKNII